MLIRLLEGEVIGTRFQASDHKRITGRQHWIVHLSKVKGRVIIDDGAAQALKRRGSSLLPIGVCEVQGQFERGDTVEICSESGAVIGKGLVGYDHETLNLIKGHRSEE